MLPKHLEYLASDVRCLTLTSRITVKCPCGCVEHQIYVAKLDEADALADKVMAMDNVDDIVAVLKEAAKE